MAFALNCSLVNLTALNELPFDIDQRGVSSQRWWKIIFTVAENDSNVFAVVRENHEIEWISVNFRRLY